MIDDRFRMQTSWNRFFTRACLHRSACKALGGWRLFGSPGTLPLLGFSWLAIMIRDVPKAILQFTVVCG